MLSVTAGLVAALLATANAHMFLQSPTPIEGNAVKDPLPSSGPGFPCHAAAIPTSGGEEMAAGSSQRLSFDLGGGYNTAVHGGGSCQISISYDTDPTALANPDNWKVIHSIEGSCPSSTAGNLDGSYTGPQGAYTGAIACSDPRSNGIDCVNEFNFTIPKGVKSGHAIMAWTWYNTIGNRELYMNCINTQITGGDGSEMDEFPSMFVANTEVNKCVTEENSNTKFAYPGKYLTTEQNTKNPTAQKPLGGACANLGAPASGNAGSPPAYGSGQPSAAPSSAAASSPASGYAAPPASSAHQSNGAPSSVAAGGGLVTVTTMQTVTSGAASSLASAPASSAPAPSGSAPAAPSYAPAPSGSSSSTGSGSCPAGAVPCNNPGAVVCGSTTQFGLCDINNCAVLQAVASGTHCQGGKVLKRDRVRRHLGHHLRREF